MSRDRLGIAGRIAALFQDNPLTPLIALVAALLGLFAVLVTPREEEPQIDVTMANVLIPFPGAAVKDVEQMVAIPAEQVLSRMPGLEHVYSVSRPGMALLTVQFEVGVPRESALVRLYDVVHSNADWLPPGLGTLPPLVKAKGIDDVPIVTLTLWSERDDASAYALERVAHLLENEIKRLPGTREVRTLGGPGRLLEVRLDTAALANAGLSLAELRAALRGANQGLPAGDLIADNRSLLLQTGAFLDSAEAVAALVVGVRDGAPLYLHQVAEVVDGPAVPNGFVRHYQRGGDGEHPAVTLQVTKKAGANAVDVAREVIAHVESLRGVLVPDDVRVTVSRDYGATADDKARTLIKKLGFATASVVALVLLALGRREAAIVGAAVLLTLTATLFASWAWGFTLNRVSLFALIFSIGILVDDAIVVVENIHRHRLLDPDAPLRRIIPAAVDEVGGPTILATLTVIAALLPMAFVTGLMGPYMAPIPINASMGMLISLAVAFVVTPWLAVRWLGKGRPHRSKLPERLHGVFARLFAPFLHPRRGGRARAVLGAAVLALIAAALALPAMQAVVLKMLPFDNKSEFQVLVDMPTGTALERTAIVLQELGEYLRTVPEVTDYQAYAGLAAPINFNGLVRQYDLRAGGDVGDIQVNLLPKSERAEPSHALVQRLRAPLEAIAARHGAELELVEVPPGPPVLAPIVAEIYGPDDDRRLALARQVRAAFAATDGIVAVDDSGIDPAPRLLLTVDRAKASLLGVPQAEIAATLRAGLSGEDITFIHDGASKYPTPVRLTLPAEHRSRLDELLKLTVTGRGGAQVPIAELTRLTDTEREQPISRKDGLPVVYVTADKGGANDSPLYGMFAIRAKLAELTVPAQGALAEHFIAQPRRAWDEYGLKWDGEWQITYETFRDMGAAYAVGLVLIYLLVVAQFRSYLAPLVIMAPIPLTVIGVMPGHALLGAQFTATSMIGMIALAGIIVRNSILLVDFIDQQLAQGVAFRDAVVASAAARAQPIVLTALAAMLGAFFILDDPIFNGLAVALIFGVLVSTALTLVVIPLLYYAVYRRRHEPAA